MANQDGPVILYGVNIHQAISSGDRGKMEDVAKQAEDYLSEVGDLSAALEVLKAEISKTKGVPDPSGGHGGPVPLYGVVIHEAIASGDVGKMEEVAKMAEAQLKESGDVSAALSALKLELSK